jgi:hypothetical protein
LSSAALIGVADYVFFLPGALRVKSHFIPVGNLAPLPAEAGFLDLFDDRGGERREERIFRGPGIP